MAKSTRQYVFEGMELLPEALTPFVERRLEASLQGHWQIEVAQKVGLRPNANGQVGWDQQGLLKAMISYWGDAFRSVLGHAERSYVGELLEIRNKLSHNETFTYDDAERALDSMRRLMEAISASDVADQLGKMRDTILRTKFTELQRNEERKKSQRSDISVETVAGLLPWREVVEPHRDVATGEFQQAEFAADLAKVHNGSAPSEYRNPTEFFSRTYLTSGLSTLLIGAAKRLSGTGGDPVVELQTNFGGGKTPCWRSTTWQAARRWRICRGWTSCCRVKG
ncbi:Swt1 family HEPN domain-containing protein [Gemmobacter lanyuensis]|uniref:Swt1 family HEPN domain-containing protein n=1 Tax=Gemmobacter lanyuensis TaxID=1054497 RepID=UPI003607E169